MWGIGALSKETGCNIETIRSTKKLACCQSPTVQMAGTGFTRSSTGRDYCLSGKGGS